MLHSKRRHEGYLLLDNRCSEGVSDAAMRVVGDELPPGAGRGVFEAPTYTCSHCQRVVVMNPLRTRAREYCPKCDHFICDGCGAVRASDGGECKTFKQVVDEILQQAIRADSAVVSLT